jgi:CspA family cold shock protein
MMPQGNVKWFDKKKGYGFVSHEDQDIYIHWSEMESKFVPEENDLISFEIVSGEKGPKATNITKVG